MLYHNQPLKGAYLAVQVIAILFIYMPYWLLVSIPHFFKPPPEKYRIHAITRQIGVGCLRKVMLVIHK